MDLRQAFSFIIPAMGENMSTLRHLLTAAENTAAGDMTENNVSTFLHH